MKMTDRTAFREKASTNTGKLTRFMTSPDAWAMGLGTSIGWGSFVITSNTYLSHAGPLGSTLGMIAGALLMLVISRSYHVLMNRYPDCGGIYSYARHAFGYDYGFLTGWFLCLTYFAMLWANATSLPIFARYLIGDVLQFGFSYEIFGYRIFLGEVLLPVAAIILTGLLCMFYKRVSIRILTVLVFIIVLGIVSCFLCVSLKQGTQVFHVEHAFAENPSAFRQVLGIACISPWAFIGFENISHMTEETTFPAKKSFRILALIIIATTALYIFVVLLSVTAWPPEYNSYLEYIRDLDNLTGLKALPTFYAAEYYLGHAGVTLLMLTLFSLIVTSLIGNITALSRIIFALSRDDVISKKFRKLSKDGSPINAIALVVGISIFIPFLGRIAIGWIVDVTTIGATLIYAFVSAAALKVALKTKKKADIAVGVIGLTIMSVFEFLLLFPNLLSFGGMARESYLFFTIWAIIGFLFFNHLLRREAGKHRFGHSLVVWVALLFMTLFTALAWMNQEERIATNQTLYDLQEYTRSIAGSTNFEEKENAYIESEILRLEKYNNRNTLLLFCTFLLALGVVYNNYALMRKREVQIGAALDQAKNKANTDPLTGVKSRHAFLEFTKGMNERIEKGEQLPFAIAMCDINDLKKINDTFGHAAGDRHIYAACRLICTAFSHSPVFRVGGDEFAVVLTGTDYEDRDRIASKFNEEMERNGVKTGIRIALGMSVYNPGQDFYAESVFNRADALMYLHKEDMKARYE